MRRDAVLNIRLPADIKEALQRAADVDDRSLSRMAAKALREWLESAGYIPKATGPSRAEAQAPRPRQRGR